MDTGSTLLCFPCGTLFPFPYHREKKERNTTKRIAPTEVVASFVKGRGREDVHNRKTQDEKPEVPTIAMDYCFMGKENKKPITILVVKDADNKAMKGFTVNQKGSGDGEIVKKVQRLIDDQWGRRKIRMKADKESTIRELRDRIREGRTDERLFSIKQRSWNISSRL